MTEASQIYHTARDHLALYGQWERVENVVVAGFPDVYYLLRRVPGWVECKMFDGEARPRNLTLDQVRWAASEVSWGGRWHLLGLLGREWLLYDLEGARALLKGDPSSTPLFRRAGPFPTLPLLDLLAPTART